MMRPISLIAVLVAGLLLTSCGGETASDTKTRSQDPDKEISRIEEQEEMLFDAMGQHSDSLATEVMASYQQFIDDNPDHERTPEFLFRSANIARSYKKYDKALANYQRIVSDYPEYENIVESHFLMAFMYDNDFKDKAKAEEVYKEVANKYADHIFGKQAKERLKTLHLTDQELIERFKEKNKENPSN